MDKNHSLIIFSDIYPIEDIANELTNRMNPNQIENPEFNSVLLEFISPKKNNVDIPGSLLQRDPMVFLISYLISYQVTKEHDEIHKHLQDKYCSTILEFVKKEKETIEIDDLKELLSKNLPFKITDVKIENGQMIVPLECCLDDMARYVEEIRDFKAFVSLDYIDSRLPEWIHDGLLELNRISPLLFKQNPSFISRGEDFMRIVEEYDVEIRKYNYSLMPYDEKMIRRRFSIIYKALKQENLIGEEVTGTKVRRALENYIPEKESENKHIAYLLNENASKKTIEKIEKRHADTDNNIHRTLSSQYLQSKVRIVRSRWLKYVVYSSAPKFSLETFQDLDRLMMFPCMKKIFDNRGGPHNVLAAFFSVLLWFYTKKDCHYILKSIIGFPNYDYARTEQQLSSLLEDGDTPRYLYGPRGFAQYCEVENNESEDSDKADGEEKRSRRCSVCWITALKFPDRYHEKRTTRHNLRKEKRND